eukprot:2638262-Pyramimonas_sp.AAC.1
MGSLKTSRIYQEPAVGLEHICPVAERLNRGWRNHQHPSTGECGRADQDDRSCGQIHALCGGRPAAGVAGAAKSRSMVSSQG